MPKRYSVRQDASGEWGILDVVCSQYGFASFGTLDVSWGMFAYIVECAAGLNNGSDDRGRYSWAAWEPR